MGTHDDLIETIKELELEIDAWAKDDVDSKSKNNSDLENIVKCGICGSSENLDDPVYCSNPNCKAQYHKDCWDFNKGQCARYGCGSENLPALYGNNSLINSPETLFENLWDNFSEFYLGSKKQESRNYAKYVPLIAAALNPAAGLILLGAQWSAIALNSYDQARECEKDKELLD